jgi:prepilin-type N-terminal cleavage/methylation domain-containing protein
MMYKGFSLIELLVVIGIVGLLAAIAVPAYKNYTIKTKIAAAMHAAEPIMLAEFKHFATKGVFAWPNDIGFNGHYMGGCTGCISPAYAGSPAGLDYIYIGDVTYNFCAGLSTGRVGQFQLTFNNTLTGTAFQYNYDLLNIGGTISAFCVNYGGPDVGTCLASNSGLRNAKISAACTTPL